MEWLPELARIELPPRVLRDADIRPVVRQWATSMAPSAMREEVGLEQHKSRIDFLLAYPESLTGIEIKAQTDTLGPRWDRQQEAWNRLIDTLWLVITGNHIKKATRGGYVPPHWGICVARTEAGFLVLDQLRPPGPRDDRYREVSPEAQAHALWKSELLSLATKLPKESRPSSKLSRYSLASELFKRLPPEVFAKKLRDRYLNWTGPYNPKIHDCDGDAS